MTTDSSSALARLLLIAAGVLLFPAWSLAASSTVFYVIGHQDDWQLFMNPNAYADAQHPDAKLVFIYTTAGDAGCGRGCVQNDGRTPYFLAREEGANRAVRFMETSPGTLGTRTRWSWTFANGHFLTKRIYNDSVSYFLRLPDGFPGGTGHPDTGFQSLQRLYLAQISSITDVVGWNTYHGWFDLVETLRQIIVAEAAGNPNVWVNIPDPNLNANVGDHSDHTHTGLAVLDAVVSLPCVNKAKFLNYVTGGMPGNLSDAQSLQEAAVWGATVSGLVDRGARSTFDGGHNAWMGRNYYSVETGTGACAL